MAWKHGFVAILMLFCISSSAQNNNKKTVENTAIWEPPSAVEFPGSVKANISREMISDLRVAGERIVLDETELKAVQGYASEQAQG
jgi:glycerol-3-phosphate responsive antiterminator